MSDVTALLDLPGNVDVFFSLFAGSLVFMMQCGFAMLCAGSLRQKNAMNIMLQNILDACGGALGYFFLGYGFAFAPGNSFIGTHHSYFALSGMTKGSEYISFFFQFAFAASAATIVAGTIAERCKMVAYFCYAFFLTAWVYPVVVHAVWNGEGFLSTSNVNPFRGVGMIDFAGSGVVHMTGGTTALVGAIILGPRIGRFYDNNGNPLPEPASWPAHSVALQVLGTFLLWFGWYGFNPGSSLSVSTSAGADAAALAAVTTTLSGASACVSAMFTDTLLGLMATGESTYNLTMAMNGGLAGLVGITGGCAVVTPWASIAIGIVSGWVYVFSSKLLIKLRIDDAVDGVPVHFFAGMWGCIATGLFAEPSRIAIYYGQTAAQHAGWFYSWGKGSGDFNLMLAEICGILFIVAWTVGIMVPFFLILNALGLFRLDPVEEMAGMDISKHGGSVYNDSSPGKKEVDALNLSRSGSKKAKESTAVNEPEP